MPHKLQEIAFEGFQNFKTSRGACSPDPPSSISPKQPSHVELDPLLEIAFPIVADCDIVYLKKLVKLNSCL